MPELIEKILRKVSRRAGSLATRLGSSTEERKASQYTDCYRTIKKLLEHHKPQIIYDIGANSGTWSTVLAALDPELREDVLFEPQKKHATALSREGFLPNVKKTFFGVALGDKETSANIKGGTSCASFLEINQENNESFPLGVEDTSEEARIKTLDDIRTANNLPFPDTIKIDVQGYELRVLAGATQTLERTKYLIVELSFRELYIGQPAASEVFAFLEKKGFTFVEYGYEWRNKTGEIVQLDAIFVNSRL